MLPRREPRLREERVVGGHEDFSETSGRWPIELLRHRHRVPLVDGRQLGLAAAPDDRHHPVTLGEAQRARPQRGHLAGELHAGDVLGPAGRRRVAAPHLMQVTTVHAGGPDPHEQLTHTGRGVRVLFDMQLAVDDRGRPHGGGS